MLIKTEVDISGALATLDLILRKIPYATNNALTRTANELIEVERTQLRTQFQERSDFIPNRIQILKYSRPNDLWTRVGIREVQRSLLSFFESGAMKTPERGSQIAVPLTGEAARPSFAQKLRDSQFFYRSLRLRPKTTSTGKIQYKGKERTFVIPQVGVAMRTGPGKRDVQIIYAFKRTAPLDTRMHFVRTAQDFVPRRFAQVWREEFVREMAGKAKGK